jgi:transposase
MTLHPIEQWQIPAQTVRVAQAAFPKGNIYMKMYEQLGQLYLDSDFQALYRSHCGQLALSPARLALITVMQFAEGLSDRQAAESVRSRIDWKYALGLELTDSGFDHSVLNEWRCRLISRGYETQLLDLILEKLKQQKLLKSRGSCRTDSTHVLAAIRRLNRLELVGETLRYALNELAIVAPEWLKATVNPDWFDRYKVRFEQYRLPQEKTEQELLAVTIGADGNSILQAIDERANDRELSQLVSVEILRQVWLQQYTWLAGQLVWRDAKNTGLPPGKLLIQSPIDPQARNRTKRNTNWTGYTVHLTETCDEDSPNLITNVETTPATLPDGAMTPVIHGNLAQKDLLPSTHLLDTAYIDAEHLVTATDDYGVNLIGRVQPDSSWQAKTPGSFALSCFEIDFQSQMVTCPAGEQSQSWRERTDDYGNHVIEVRFHRAACANCTVRHLCTTAKTEPRLLKFRPQKQYQALKTARANQATTEFQRQYAKRAGIEGTISQGCRAFNLRRSRYIGLAKTHLQHIAIATAINLYRLIDWFNQIPKAKSRTTPFFCLSSTATVPPTLASP